MENSTEIQLDCIVHPPLGPCIVAQWSRVIVHIFLKLVDVPYNNIFFKKTSKAFLVFAINNFHLLHGSNINNSAKNSAPRSKITSHMEETIKKKQKINIKKTTTIYSFVPKYTEEKRNI